MAAVATMPGNWPLRDEVDNEVEFHYPRINTQLAEPTLQVPASHSATSATSSRGSSDELFFNTPEPSSRIGNNGESSAPSYLIFEPVVETVSRDELIDWRRYEPPQELLHAQDGISEEIRRILKPSIERIKARHAEEEQQRIAQARRDRPLARTGRASVKPPKREPLMTGALHPLAVPSSEGGSSSRISTRSVSSMLSTDSGYVSQTPNSPNLSPSSPSRDAHGPTPSRPGKTRAFGFSHIFGRKNKPSFNFDGLGVEQNSRPASSASGEISISVPVPTQGAVTAPTTIIECVSCLDDFESSDMVPLACHSYCTECFTRLITTALESETHWPAKCCLNPIPSTTIVSYINNAMKAKYAQREAEWSIPASDRIYCAQPTCSTWIPPKNVDTQTHSAKCPSCAHKACTICRGPFHNGSDCPQDPALLATINLAELEGWKRCYQCHALVEHNKGCRHMTCRCKAQFCYICSAKWRTCSCTDTQLAEIQQRAENHRTQQAAETARQARERARREAAAEEERIVLQMVIDFEAAEAERERVAAEARRMREEEERRIREEERRRREEERIAAVNARFRQLATELDTLHDTQRVLIAERYEFETSRLQRALQDELDVFSIRHPAEIAALTARSKELIASTEQKFLDEYQIRLTEERRTEETYISDLRAFWSGKLDAEFKVRDARDELRRDQDKEYRFWDHNRRTQLAALREGEERKMERLRVKQRAEIKAAEGRTKIDEVEWKRSMWAEGKWVEVVLIERVDILEAAEREEYAREG